MFTKSTIGLAVILVAASGALSASARQHPWVPTSGMYTGSLPNGDAPTRAYGRIFKNDIVDLQGWRTSKPATDELYDDACHSSHSVFSCPGTP